MVSGGAGGGGRGVVPTMVVTVVSAPGPTVTVVSPLAAVLSGATTVVPVSTLVLSLLSSPPITFTEKPTTSPSATPPAIELVSHLRG